MTPRTLATWTGGGAPVRDQRRHPEPEHDGVGTAHPDRLRQVVDARREDQVLAAGERAVDPSDRCARAGDEELADRHRAACGGPARPGRARRVVLDRGNEDPVAAGCLVQERLLLRHRAGGQRRVGLAARHAERLRWRAVVTGEDLVPDAVGPAVEIAVPDDELLL